MDIKTTVANVKEEYEAYLLEKHPEWNESTVRRKVANAFYAWGNSIVPSFWKCLVDDETMETARQSIYDY